MLNSTIVRRVIPSLKPSSELNVSDWASKNRIMTAFDSPASGQPFSIDRVPYSREIMNWFLHPKVRMIVLKMGTQIGKTNMTLNMLGYAMAERPGPIMLALPTSESVDRFSATRIDPMVEASPALRSIKLSKWRKAEKHFAGGVLYLATSQSSAQLSSSSVEVVICDELKDFKDVVSSGSGDPIKYAIDRTKTFPYTKKIVLVSSPSVENSPIDKYFKSCEQQVYYWVECPHCHEKFLFEFAQLKFGDEDFDDFGFLEKTDSQYWIQARKHAYYECVHCSGKIVDHMKPKILRTGKWLTSKGDPIPEDTISIGCQLNSMYSLDLKFGDVAHEFLESRLERNKMQNFINGWLGEEWKEDSVGTSSDELKASICSLEPVTVPTDTVALTCGIDVQKDHFYFSVWAWDKLGNGWMIQYGVLSTWDEVNDLVHKNEYPIVDSKRTMGIWRAAIDTGGGVNISDEDGGHFSTTEATYHYLRQHGRGKIFGVKGSSTKVGGVRVKMSMLDKFPNGKTMPGGLALYMVNTDEFKETLFWRLGLDEGEVQKLYFHCDTGDDWFKHLTAEKKVMEKNGTWRWKKVRTRNDWLDTCVYNLALIDPQFGGGLAMLSAPVGLSKVDDQFANLDKQIKESSYLSSVHHRTQGGWLKRKR